MSLVGLLRSLPDRFKRGYKMHMFRKHAILGNSFSCSAGANCLSANPSSIVIGDYCEICSTLSVKPGGTITIGDYTTMRGGLIGACKNVRIGSYVIISNNVHIYDNNNHPTDPEARLEMSRSGVSMVHCGSGDVRKVPGL